MPCMAYDLGGIGGDGFWMGMMLLWFVMLVVVTHVTIDHHNSAPNLHHFSYNSTAFILSPKCLICWTDVVQHERVVGYLGVVMLWLLLLSPTPPLPGIPPVRPHNPISFTRIPRPRPFHQWLGFVGDRDSEGIVDIVVSS